MLVKYKMKLLAKILHFFLFLLLYLYIEAGEVQDFKVKLFDDANTAYIENIKDASLILKSDDVRVGKYAYDFLIPYEVECLKLRRYCFVRTISGANPPKIRGSTPWIWALDTPSEEDTSDFSIDSPELEQILAEYRKAKTALVNFTKSNKDILVLRNEIYRRNRIKMNAVEQKLSKRLSEIQELAEKSFRAL